MTFICITITVSKDTPPHKTDNDNDDDKKKPEKGAPVFSCFLFAYISVLLVPERAVDVGADVALAVALRTAVLAQFSDAAGSDHLSVLESRLFHDAFALFLCFSNSLFYSFLSSKLILTGNLTILSIHLIHQTDLQSIRFIRKTSQRRNMI